MSTKEKSVKMNYDDDTFVEIYKDEIDTIKNYKKDFQIFDELEKDDRREVELDARTYYRRFARLLFDESGGMIAEDEAMPICERYEELMKEFQIIEDLESEKSRIEHEIHIQDLEEQQINQTIKNYHTVLNGQSALFISSSIMAFAAIVLSGFSIWHYKILENIVLVPGIAVIFIAVMVLLYFYRAHKKDVEKENVYGTMKSNRRIVSSQTHAEYETCCKKLGFYYEKYETIFSYIGSKQWKLFGFCAKVLEVIESRKELQKERKRFEDSMNKFKFKYPKMWLLYTRALYDKRKREQLEEQWDIRIHSLEQGILKHTKNIDRGETE